MTNPTDNMVPISFRDRLLRKIAGQFGVPSQSVKVEDQHVIWEDPDDGCERYLIQETGYVIATYGDEMKRSKVPFQMVCDEQGRVFEYGFYNENRFYPHRLDGAFQVQTVLTDKEGEANSDQRVTVNNEEYGYGLELLLDGFGVVNANPGQGGIVFLEKFQGKTQLVVWADITQEDPTHTIDLEKAKECYRPDDEPEEELNKELTEVQNARRPATQIPLEVAEGLEQVCYECLGKFPARLMIPLVHDPDRASDHICVKCNGLKEHESKTGELFVVVEALESGFSASGYYLQAQADAAMEALTRAGRYSMGPFVAPAPGDVMAERTLYKMIEDMLSQQTKEILETKDA